MQRFAVVPWLEAVAVAVHLLGAWTVAEPLELAVAFPVPLAETTA
jgi:hypothetical protein